jgi:hypothetical protein
VTYCHFIEKLGTRFHLPNSGWVSVVWSRELNFKRLASGNKIVCFTFIGQSNVSRDLFALYFSLVQSVEFVLGARPILNCVAKFG